MKRIALVLSVVALLLGSAVYAPAAMAKKAPGQVNIQEARLGPGGSVIVSGNVECTRQFFDLIVTVHQRSNVGTKHDFERCTSAFTPFTVIVFGEKSPFERGTALMDWVVRDCGLSAGCIDSRGDASLNII